MPPGNSYDFKIVNLTFSPKHDILFTDVEFSFNETDETQTFFISPKEACGSFLFFCFT